MRIIGNDLARFESYVVPEPMCGCWLWTGALDGHDYGHFWMSGKIIKAHRAAWQLYHGEIPEGQWVLHQCDTPPCVSPYHIFLGDRTDNMRDMAAKSRQVFQAHPEKAARGEKSYRAKFTDDEVRNIKLSLARGAGVRAMARELGVSPCTISSIKVGRNWAHIEVGIESPAPAISADRDPF